MGLAYRCSIRRLCGIRKTLKMPIDWYKRRPLCLGCGKDTLKPVWQKERERSERRGCFCQGMGWPHNRGRIEDENHICAYADYHEAEGVILAIGMGGTITKLHPDDPPPF